MKLRSLLKINPGYTYRITEIRRIVDGDTMDCTIAVVDWHYDLGFHLTLHFTLTAAYRFRLGIADAYETNEAGGAAATAYAADWLATPRGELWGRTEKTDSFGRWLILFEDRYTDEHGQPATAFLDADLMAAGHAVPYRRATTDPTQEN